MNIDKAELIERVIELKEELESDFMYKDEAALKLELEQITRILQQAFEV